MTNQNDNGILSQAREFVHDKVRTEARKEEEKSYTEKAVDTACAFKDDVVERFNERIDEGTVRAERHEADSTSENKPGLMAPVKEQVNSLRENIYDATKSKAEKEADREAEKPILEQAYNKVSAIGQDFTDRLNDRMDEGTPRENQD